MRKALLFAACSLSAGAAFHQRFLVHTESESKEPKKLTPDTPKDLKFTEIKYGFDICQNRLKDYSTTDRRKVNPVFKTRAEHLANLKDPSKTFDVLIIGGGCNGAGTLLEGTARGLNCALIDRNDFASETSSRSTKLIHGGVRYLQEVFRFERGAVEKFKLVFEGLDERNFMLNTAPYMNTKLELVIPCTNLFWLGYYYIGASMYHFLSYVNWWRTNYAYKLPRPSFVGRNMMKELFPLMKGNNYGVKFCEGQMNDARLLIQTLLTSTQDNYIPNMKGATVANYVEFVDFIKSKEGKCIGAKLRDRLNNTEFDVKAKAIVNCAGIFSDHIRTLDNPQVAPRIVPSRGIHIAIPHKYTEKDVGVLIPYTSDKRVMFVLPYRGYTLAGTTDHKCDIDSAPIAPESDIIEVANELSNYFAGNIKDDCTAAWCGIRPLVLADPSAPAELGVRDKIRMMLGKGPTKASTRALTRNHVVEVTKSGLVSLMGGKWTSYRRMGQDTIDAVLKNNPNISVPNKLSVTRNMRLIGGYNSKTLDKTEKDIHEFVDAYRLFLHEKYSLAPDVAASLVEMYGANAPKVVALGEANNLNGLIHKGVPIIKAQVLYAIRNEMATNVRDVLFRRLGVGFASKQTAEEMISSVADLMAKELDWSEEKKQEEIDTAKKHLLTLG